MVTLVPIETWSELVARAFFLDQMKQH